MVLADKPPTASATGREIASHNEEPFRGTMQLLRSEIAQCGFGTRRMGEAPKAKFQAPKKFQKRQKFQIEMCGRFLFNTFGEREQFYVWNLEFDICLEFGV